MAKLKTFSIPESEEEEFNEAWAIFRECCHTEGTDFSKKIRELILSYAKSHGKGNFAFKLDEWQANPSFAALPTLAEIPKKHYLSHLTDSDLKRIGNFAEAWARGAWDELDKRARDSADYVTDEWIEWIEEIHMSWGAVAQTRVALLKNLLHRRTHRSR
tara:strand:+ start:297 stop:773 length:477 start_codon:yes stop_codon:yes gene_type:complete